MESPCPICHKPATQERNPYRPFCSERCKLIDLESWMSGRYRVPVEKEFTDGEDSVIEQEPFTPNGDQ